MKKCPNCSSARYTESKEGKSCKKCGFVNKPFGEEYYVTDVEDKKQEKRYKKGGGNRCQK